MKLFAFLLVISAAQTMALNCNEISKVYSEEACCGSAQHKEICYKNVNEIEMADIVSRVAQIQSRIDAIRTDVEKNEDDSDTFDISHTQYLDAVQLQEGSQGATGPRGATGATGQQGTSGNHGNDGATGQPGAAGATGATGAAGQHGATGPPGNHGNHGATGPSGTDGVAGATGPSGAAGATGATGPSGTDGVDGSDGADGCSICIWECAPTDEAPPGTVCSFPGSVCDTRDLTTDCDAVGEECTGRTGCAWV